MHNTVYDVCVIGGGIAGKYVASKLEGLNVAWVSAQHSSYHSDSDYRIDDFLGAEDTWSEKATGLITFPEATDLTGLPHFADYFWNHRPRIAAELGIISLEGECAGGVIEYNQRLAEDLKLTSPQYFWSAFDTSPAPSSRTREEFDLNWMERKRRWDFLNGTPEEGFAEHFELKEGGAECVHIRDTSGNVRRVFAKQFVVACHTPGTIALLWRTQAAYPHLDLFAGRLGIGFYDHPQLSFGVIRTHTQAWRDLPPAMIYSDEKTRDLSYRIEVHNAPPRDYLIAESVKHFPSLTPLDYYNGFMRITAVIPTEPLSASELHITSDKLSNIKSHHEVFCSISPRFYQYIEEQRDRVAAIVLEKHLSSSGIVVLNHHRPIFFGGHMGGGTCHPDIIEGNFALRSVKNVRIASLSGLPTVGLFNPTFLLLTMCDYVATRLLSTE